MSMEEQARTTCRIGGDDPTSIVDHRQAREEYVQLGKRAAAR